MSVSGDEREDLPAAAAAQDGRGPRRRLWDAWRLAGTGGQQPGPGGTASGTGGGARRSYWQGLIAVSVLVFLFNAVNVTSNLHDLPGIDPLEPVIWEATSWVTFTLFAFIPWLALQAAPLSSRSRPRFALVHAAAMLAFAFLHIAGFILLRKLVYGVLGGHYTTGVFTQFWYEFRKDIFGYLLAVLAFHWMAQRLAAKPDGAAAGRARFDIRDGARLIRVPTAQILAVTAAGNYVEFVLGDGRRPLMRAALSAIEAELAPCGFVRTHRSWLVNAGAVTGLSPQGSGDYTVELPGLTVPLSRRFPQALQAIRG